MSDIKSIFISYRRQDSSGHTGRLFDYLSANLTNVNVFMDVMGIDPGEDWKQTIKASIDGCSIMLVVIGKYWLTLTDNYGRRRLDLPDDPVKFEIQLGIENPDVRVIPILAGGAQLPEEIGLPQEVTDLLSANAFKIEDDTFHDDSERLVRKLRVFLRDEPQQFTTFSELYGIRMDNLAINPNWHFQELNSFCEISSGRAVKRDYEDGEFPLYNATGIVDYINISQEDQDSLLMPSTFRMGQRPQIFNVQGGFSASQFLLIIVPDHNIVFIDYLWFILSYYDYRELIARSTTLAGIPRIKRRDIGQLLIPLPTLDEQIKITDVISEIIDGVQSTRETLQIQNELIDELEISLIKQLLQGDLSK